MTQSVALSRKPRPGCGERSGLPSPRPGSPQLPGRASLPKVTAQLWRWVKLRGGGGAASALGPRDRGRWWAETEVGRPGSLSLLGTPHSQTAGRRGGGRAACGRSTGLISKGQSPKEPMALPPEGAMWLRLGHPLHQESCSLTTPFTLALSLSSLRVCRGGLEREPRPPPGLFRV